MASRASLLLLIGLLLAACSAAPQAHDSGKKALARYDELCRFLPSGMQSYWFSDWTSDNPMARFEPGRRLIARAATDFRPPPNWPAMGHQSSVEVIDWGIAQQAAFEEILGQHWINEPPIASNPIWRTPTEAEDKRQMFWIAFVDARYEVTTTSRELMQRAIARKETRRHVLNFAPDLSILSNAASDVIFCRPRPQPKTQFACPSPTSLLIAEVHAKQQRVAVFATERQGHIKDYYALGKNPSIGETTERDGYYVFEMQFENNYLIMVLTMLFGTHIAI